LLHGKPENLEAQCNKSDLFMVNFFKKVFMMKGFEVLQQQTVML
jgi:hypothetical protein